MVFWSAKNQRKDTFFPPSIPFPWSFLQLQQSWHLYCVAILGSISTVIHSVKQRLLRNRPGSALRPLATSCAKDYKAHSLGQTSFAESPNSGCLLSLQTAPDLRLFSLQTNVGNNNNKYYIIQLLEETGKKAYYVWQRWGRVGYKGQTNLVTLGGDLDKAKQAFTKKWVAMSVHATQSLLQG